MLSKAQADPLLLSSESFPMCSQCLLREKVNVISSI